MKVLAVPDKCFLCAGARTCMPNIFTPHLIPQERQPLRNLQSCNNKKTRPRFAPPWEVEASSPLHQTSRRQKKQKLVAWLPGESRSLEESDELLGSFGDVVGELDDLLGLEAEVRLRLLVWGWWPVFALLPQPHSTHGQLVQGFLHLARGAPLHTSVGGEGGGLLAWWRMQDDLECH